MNATIYIKTSRTLACACLLLTLIGCRTSNFVPRGFEYRYRVFEAGTPLPSSIEEPYADDILAQRFLPVGAFNRSMDLLTREGFQLIGVDRLPGSSWYKFTFRKPLEPGSHPSIVPREFTGVYQVETPGDTTTYYAFSPAYSGYTVLVFKGGSNVPQVIDTTWDGERLTTREDGVSHGFMLSGDGLKVIHIHEQVLPDGLDRRVVYARRIQTGRP